MASADLAGPRTNAPSKPAAGKPRRPSTAHLKEVPQDRAGREALRTRALAVAARLDKSRPLSKNEMEALARRLLDDAGQPESYLGWTMVWLASGFWHDQVAAVPHARRLLLLPHCLKHAEGCPADYDEFGLDCRRCGACSIADFRGEAERLGYKVLVAEGSPIVMKIIVSGHVDAIVGVACLNVLEKAIDKILAAGIPCMAVPLLSSDCRNTSVDEDWVAEMIRLEHRAPITRTRSYVHLMRAAAGFFESPELERLAPRSRTTESLAARNGQGLAGLDPVAATEAIALDFLAKGGKHSRPFITLAVYDALTGGAATLAEGPDAIAAWPTAVKRTALAIETFHKASLVHDDIEDGDPYRYGEQTVHARYGTATAINVGDYLIGLGYRLVSREAAALGPEAAADILDRLAAAHMKLSEGQGAELIWRDRLDKQLSPLDAMKIGALKTAPAFEAALLAGARLAGDYPQLEEPLAQFARHLGVAFQILNDLADWETDDHNKLASGGDVAGGRPTLLWALALANLPAAERGELARSAAQAPGPVELARIAALYRQAGVFEQAHRLVDKYQQRAEAVADAVEPEELRRLLYYLVDTVLERPAAPAAPAVVPLELPAGLDVVARP